MAKKAKAIGDPTQAVAYLRVSTEDQRLGPEAQRSAIERWASSAGVTVIGWHVDQGVSGAAELDARPGLAAALGELRARGAGLLVIAKRDRLARDVVVAGLVERAVAQCGASIVSAAGEGNGSTEADGFMRNVLAAAAEYERAMIRGRTRAALQVKKDRGERVGAVPFGYRLAADGVHLEAHPAEQATIATVLELRAQGLSLRGIVAELERRGVTSRAGRGLGVTQINRILAARPEATDEPARIAA